jgi:hypothetical protein
MCNHEKICVECIKAEIAEHKKKIEELEKKLPVERTIIRFPIVPMQPWTYQCDGQTCIPMVNYNCY